MELNYKDFGQGYPVIILHGMFGTLDNWQGIAKQLAESYSVYIIDLRNHGRSPHVAGMSYTLMAEDIRAFMEAHWIYEAAIIGHSMGGKVAMQLAMDNPEMVSRLAVLDIAPKAYKGGHEQVLRALHSIDLVALSDRKDAENQLMQLLDNDASTVQFLLKNLSRSKEGSFEWKMNLPEISKHYQDILAEVTGDSYPSPTLFIKGGRSQYITDADWPTIQSLFPAAQLQNIPDAGHWVHAEQPALVNSMLKDFLVGL